MKAPKKIGGECRQTRWVLPDREWLEYHYVTLEKSSRILADEIGVTDMTIAKWCKKLGIPPRTHDQAVHTLRFREDASWRLLGQIGDQSRCWLGGAATHRSTYHLRARTVLLQAQVPRVCARCGTAEGKLEVHHVDGDPRNNDISNLAYLCPTCHKYTDNCCGGQISIST